MDSQYVHREVVKPAIMLLQDDMFQGASDEFLRAHEHYRQGRDKEAIVEAEKAFESTLKIICDRCGWSYPKGATAQTLINTVLTNGLIDDSLRTYLAGIRTTLEAGLPTVRNKMSAHGQGSQPVRVPDYIVAYALHAASASIVLLIQAYKAYAAQAQSGESLTQTLSQ